MEDAFKRRIVYSLVQTTIFVIIKQKTVKLFRIDNAKVNVIILMKICNVWTHVIQNIISCH